MKFIDILILFIPTDVLNTDNVFWYPVFSRTGDLLAKDRKSRLTNHEYRVLSRGLQLIQL